MSFLQNYLNTNWWLNRQGSWHQSFKALHIPNTTQNNGYRWRYIYTLSMSFILHSSRKGFRVVESSPGQLQQQDSTPITSILRTYVEELVHELQSSLSVKEHIQLPFCVVGLQKIQISIPFVSDHLPQKTKVAPSWSYSNKPCAIYHTTYPFVCSFSWNPTSPFVCFFSGTPTS
jgi:hypothetical protein